MLKFENLLFDNMSPKGFEFWKKLESKIPDIWKRSTSSTRKYHKKEDGSVPSIEEHTYEMLFAACKLLSVFEIESKTKEADVILLAIILHDSAKYGKEDPLSRIHTCNNHDHIIGDIILLSKNTFLKYFDSNEVLLLEEMCRFHSGRWSSDAPKDFSFKNLDPKTFFLHLLDMFSSRNLIKITKEI